MEQAMQADRNAVSCPGEIIIRASQSLPFAEHGNACEREG
jgi:hypothetical protein